MKIEKKKAFSNLEKRRDSEKIKIKGDKVNMVSNLDSYFSHINFFVEEIKMNFGYATK